MHEFASPAINLSLPPPRTGHLFAIFSVVLSEVASRVVQPVDLIPAGLSIPTSLRLALLEAALHRKAALDGQLRWSGSLDQPPQPRAARTRRSRLKCKIPGYRDPGIKAGLVQRKLLLVLLSLLSLFFLLVLLCFLCHLYLRLNTQPGSINFPPVLIVTRIIGFRVPGDSLNGLYGIKLVCIAVSDPYLMIELLNWRNSPIKLQYGHPSLFTFCPTIHC